MGEDILELEPDERARRACSWPSSTRRAIPGVTVAQLPAPGDQRAPQGRPDGQGRPDARSEFRKDCARTMDAAEMDDAFCQPLPERGLLRRREEARRDPADGDAEAEDRDPRRDRLGPRHRRAADRGRRRQPLSAGPRWACCSSPTTSASSNYIKPDCVHVLVDGRIVGSGGPELAHELESRRLRQAFAGRGGPTAMTPTARRTRDRDRRVQVRLPRPRGLRLQDARAA